jgi:hypothetical protein
MQLGFVGFLEMEQILHLWERILGFMDTTLLAVAAVAIFMHRSEMLFRVIIDSLFRHALIETAKYFYYCFTSQCNSEADAMMVLMEGSRLHIVTLIQMFLMKDTRHA